MRGVRVVVRGRVQGVGYRVWVEGEASRLGLAGWVRNRRNGTVEAVIAGDDKAIEAMLNAMWSGPTVAQVTAVDIEAWTAEISDGFSVWPTV